MLQNPPIEPVISVVTPINVLRGRMAAVSEYILQSVTGAW
jgi:hypothetical protein